MTESLATSMMDRAALDALQMHGQEIAWFVEKTDCVAAITHAHYAESVGQAGAALKWIAVIPTETPDEIDGLVEDDLAGGESAPSITFESLRGDAGSWDGREIEPMLP